MTLDHLHTLVDALHKEAERHRLVANENLHNKDIFIARMTAVHVMGSLASCVLALSQEVIRETPSA